MSDREAPATTEKLNTKAAGVVGLAVLCSRVLGLVREQIGAALFGGGWVMDAFTIAFRIPNLLRDLFAEGALSTVFTTVFSKTAATQGTDAAWRLANKTWTLAIIFLSALTILGIIFSPELVAALAPGFEGEKAQLTITLTRVMWPFILLVSLAALAMGMLNARNVFGVPAMASSFFNLGSIVFGVGLGWWLDPSFGTRAVMGLAIGTLVGGGLQLFVQIPALYRQGYVYRPDTAWRDPGVKSILRLMGPSVIAGSTTQANVTINSIFATTAAGNGGVFALSIAFRLMQLPLGLFGVALSTVSLPLLARMAALGNLGTFRTELARGMRLAFLLTIPATVGLIVLAGPIMSVLYQHHRYDAVQTAQAAGALQFYALGLAGYAALKVLVNSFYALEMRRTPMFVSLAAVGLNLLLNWIFTLRLGWGVRGLAFSTACIANTNFLALYLLMWRRLGRLDTGAMGAMLARLAPALLVLIAVCWAGGHFLLADWATQAFWSKLSWLMVTIVFGGSAFLGAAVVFKVAEMDQLVGVVKRRLNRGR